MLNLIVLTKSFNFILVLLLNDLLIFSDDVQSHGSVKASIHEEDLVEQLEQAEEEEDEEDAIPQDLIEAAISDTELDVTMGSQQELSERVMDNITPNMSKFNSENASLLGNYEHRDSYFKHEDNFGKVSKARNSIHDFSLSTTKKQSKFDKFKDINDSSRSMQQFKGHIKINPETEELKSRISLEAQNNRIEGVS